MARREIGTRWDRENRNNINENFKELYDVQDRAIEEATKAVIDSAKLIWLEPVNTFSDIATIYPNPEIGHTVFVRDTGKVYRFYNGSWMEIQQIDAGPVNEVDTRLNDKIGILSKRTFVTYEQFGAVLDGVADDTAAIKAAHDFANQYGYPVRQHKGIIRLTGTVDVKTDTDLSGCELIIDDNTPNTILYNVLPDSDYQNITVTQSELTEGAIKIPSLSPYKYSFIKISSDEVFAYRNGDTPYNKLEHVVHITDGAIIGGPLMDDFMTGNLTVQAKPITDKPITFRAPTIRHERTDMSYVPFAIRIKRSNTTLSNVNIKVSNLPTLESTTYKGALIGINDCYNVAIDTVNGENVSAYATYQTQPTYIIAVDNVIKLRMRNINLLRGWGIMATHYVKDVVVEDSYLNRVDNHIGCGDFYIKNTTFYGDWGSYIGWGKGKVTLDNCTNEYVEGFGTANSKSGVLLRTDWGLPFEGELNIINHTIKNHVSGIDKFSLINLYNAYSYNYQRSRTPKLPTIRVNGVTINNKYDAKIVGFFLKLGSAFSNVKLGSVQISNVKVIGESDANYFTAFEHQPEIATFAAGEVFKIKLFNIGEEIPNKYLNGFVGADFSDNVTTFNNTRKKRELIFVYDRYHSNAYEVEITNCKGNVVISAKNKLTAYNSKLSCLDLYSTNALETRIYNCLLFPFTSDTGWSTVLNLNNAEIQNSTVYCVKRDGAYVNLMFENEANAKLLLNNVLKGNNDQTKASKLFKFISTDYIQPN